MAGTEIVFFCSCFNCIVIKYSTSSNLLIYRSIINLNCAITYLISLRSDIDMPLKLPFAVLFSARLIVQLSAMS